MTVQLITIALAPAIALIWFFQARATPHLPEGRIGPWLIAVLFLLGFVSGLVALTLNHSLERYTVLWSGAADPTHRMLYWVFGIGLNEEFAKMLMLLLALFPRRDFIHPYQGLMGAAAVALGFAAIENLFYLERYGTVTLLFRSVLTVPAHAFFTAPLGVAMAYSKRARGLAGKYLWLVGALAFGMMAHGVYDVWLSLDSEWLNRMAYVHVVALGLFVLWLMRQRFPGLQAGGEGALPAPYPAPPQPKAAHPPSTGRSGPLP